MRTRRRSWKSPSFPSSSTRPARAIVEGPDDAERWIVAVALEDAGFDVAICDGPSERSGACPLVRGQGCSALATADVVVNLLGVYETAAQDVVRAVRAAAPDVGLVVQVTGPEAQRAAALLEECRCVALSRLGSKRDVVATAVHAASEREA